MTFSDPPSLESPPLKNDTLFINTEVPCRVCVLLPHLRLSSGFPRVLFSAYCSSHKHCPLLPGFHLPCIHCQRLYLQPPPLDQASDMNIQLLDRHLHWDSPWAPHWDSPWAPHFNESVSEHDTSPVFSVSIYPLNDSSLKHKSRLTLPFPVHPYGHLTNTPQIHPFFSFPVTRPRQHLCWPSSSHLLKAKASAPGGDNLLTLPRAGKRPKAPFRIW